MLQSPAAPAFNEIAPNLTARDLSSHLPNVNGKGVRAEFFHQRVKVERDHRGLPGFETRLFVKLQPIGDRFTMAVEPITPEQAQREFPEEFHAFKTYQAAPTRGTPLEELPGISTSMVGQCMILGLRSVEDLAGLTNDMAAQAGMDITSARKVAVEWLNRQRGNKDLIDGATERAALESANLALEKRLADLERALEVERAARAQMNAFLPQAGQAASGALVEVGTLVPMPENDGFMLADRGVASGLDDMIAGGPG